MYHRQNFICHWKWCPLLSETGLLGATHTPAPLASRVGTVGVSGNSIRGLRWSERGEPVFQQLLTLGVAMPHTIFLAPSPGLLGSIS